MERRINPDFEKQQPQIKLLPAIAVISSLLFIGGIESIVEWVFF